MSVGNGVKGHLLFLSKAIVYLNNYDSYAENIKEGSEFHE
jgi:hypothetical protein